jgi:hypothetical protein
VRVNEKNSKSLEAVFGLNKFSDMSPEEFQKDLLLANPIDICYAISPFLPRPSPPLSPPLRPSPPTWFSSSLFFENFRDISGNSYGVYQKPVSGAPTSFDWYEASASHMHLFLFIYIYLYLIL